MSRLLSLFSLPIFTHYLAPDTYGVISMLLVLGVALRIIVGIGSFGAAGIVYFRSGDTAHRQQTIWALLLLTVLGGMVMVALAALLSPLGSLPFGTAVESQHILITVYVAALAVQNSAEPLLMRLQFEENAVKFTVASASGAVAIVGCSMFLVAVPQLGVMGWVLGQLIGGLILLGIASIVAGRGLGRPKFVPRLIKGILRAGVPLIPGGAAIMVMLNSAPYFVGNLLGLEEAGIFGIGYQIGMGMALATFAVSTAWMPFFQSYVHRVDEASEIFPDLTTYYLAGFGFLALLFFAFAPVVVSILANERFHDAWQVVGLVAFAQMMIGLWGMLLPGLYFASETGYVSVLQIISAIATVMTHLILLPVFGIPASGLALALGASLLVMLQLTLNHLRGYSVKVVQPTRFSAILLLLIFACTVLWIIANSEFSVFHMALTSAAVILFYAAVVFFAVVPGMRRRLLVAVKKGLSLY